MHPVAGYQAGIRYRIKDGGNIKTLSKRQSYDLRYLGAKEKDSEVLKRKSVTIFSISLISPVEVAQKCHPPWVDET